MFLNWPTICWFRAKICRWRVNSFRIWYSCIV